MIVLHAKIPVKPDKRSEALELFEDLVEKSQKEKGTINYQAAIDIQDSNVVRFFEQYEDKKALDEHSQSKHFKHFKEKIPDLLDGEPDITMFEVDKSTELNL